MQFLAVFLYFMFGAIFLGNDGVYNWKVMLKEQYFL